MRYVTRQKTIKGGDSITDSSVMLPLSPHVLRFAWLDLPICRSNDHNTATGGYLCTPLPFYTHGNNKCKPTTLLCCDLLWLICAYFTGSELAWSPGIIGHRIIVIIAQPAEIVKSFPIPVDEQIWRARSTLDLVVCYHRAQEGECTAIQFYCDNHWDCGI